MSCCGHRCPTDCHVLSLRPFCILRQTEARWMSCMRGWTRARLDHSSHTAERGRKVDGHRKRQAVFAYFAGTSLRWFKSGECFCEIIILKLFAVCFRFSGRQTRSRSRWRLERRLLFFFPQKISAVLGWRYTHLILCLIWLLQQWFLYCGWCTTHTGLQFTYRHSGP